MWIFTTLGFYSIVRSNLEPDKYQVRARKREHLVNLQEHMASLMGSNLYLGEIIEVPSADYRWRLIAPQHRLANILSELLALVNYTKFKPAVHRQLPSDSDYHATLIPVWGRMLAMQHMREPLEVSNG